MIFPVAHLHVAKARIVSAALYACGVVVALVAAGATVGLALPTVAQAECVNEQLRQNQRVSNISPASGKTYDANLPDCRAYEQVSPVEKDGGSGGVFSFDSPNQAEKKSPLQSLSNGSGITYAGEPFYQIPPYESGKVGTEGTSGRNYTFIQQYTSERSVDGWTTVHEDTLAQEEVPTPVLPGATEAGAQFVKDAQVVEETPNGSKAFFLDVANTAEGEPDLYEYNVPDKELIDLTNDTNLGPHGEKLNAEVQGILGVGGEGKEEGSYVYFVAGGILAPGASEGGCSENKTDHLFVGTGCNLYLSHGGSITFIATLSTNDENEGKNSLGAGDVDWSGPNARTAEVSSNGRYVAFGSDLALTEQGAGEPEIFRYDAEALEKHEPALVCVSCGSVACASCRAVNLVSTRAEINGVNRQRYMLDDGRLLFDTTNELVPQDTNHRPDVYEWEPAGIGGCTASGEQFRDLSNGCVALISGGTSEAGESVLADASANGSDVFFTTGQSLVPQDQDEITDLYDAREGGGFPPSPEPPCPAESACPGSIPAPPALSPPASATFSGVEGAPTGVTVPTGPVKFKPLSRAQKLSKALKACHDIRKSKKRVMCEVSARKRYGSVQSKRKHRSHG